MNDRPKMTLALQAEASSADLVDQAVEWAERLEHTLHLVTVVDARFGVDPFVGMNVPDTVGLEQLATSDETHGWLSKLSERIPEAIRGGVEVLKGDVAACLLEVSKKVDLLAVGTHHRTSAARLFLGSVAEAVVRSAECPVMVLSSGARSLPVSGPVKVRLPVDPAHANTTGIEWLAQHMPKADATAVYALPWLSIFGPSPESGTTIYDTARGQLTDALAAAGHTNLPVVILAREEMNSGDAIAHEAEEARADLIVLPTHGRTGIMRAVMGSVAERTVRAATMTVVVV